MIENGCILLFLRLIILSHPKRLKITFDLLSELDSRFRGNLILIRWWKDEATDWTCGRNFCYISAPPLRVSELFFSSYSTPASCYFSIFLPSITPVASELNVPPARSVHLTGPLNNSSLLEARPSPSISVSSFNSPKSLNTSFHPVLRLNH